MFHVCPSRSHIPLLWSLNLLGKIKTRGDLNRYSRTGRFVRQLCRRFITDGRCWKLRGTRGMADRVHVSVSLITMDVLITALCQWRLEKCAAIVESNSNVTPIETWFNCTVHGRCDRGQRYNLILPVIWIYSNNSYVSRITSGVRKSRTMAIGTVIVF